MGNRNRATTAAAGSMLTVLLLASGCGSEDGGARTVTVRAAGAERAVGHGAGDGKGYGAGSEADTGTEAEADADADAGSGADPADADATPAGRLAVREIPEVGSAVTDAAGATLYRFDKDTARPSRSNCEDACATLWPPVPADGAQAPAGIDAGLLGSVERSDGTRQLTLAGWPVYRYAKDTGPGDAKGEGVGGTWRALARDGGKAAEAEPEKESAPLSAVEDAKLGKLMVDSRGRTLYRFGKDSAWPMKFGCLDSCLDTWKPAEPVEGEKAVGIPAGLVGSVQRPDGTRQLTIDCWPVYLFTGDTAPGQTNGHGLQGLWFAVDDAGKKIPAAG
ncbi:SCO0930 family lipoprotein [Streptomyces sp. NBC_00335]|uniref:SCO0930 family lipoprotein n=1 Tax=unclassified Streptomyces TaxID=2593676 RepID=UPI002251208C|nr:MULTISPECIES: SCO0930 family lipoprotein [unclassified Streptomyces]MCX5402577.1 SCO0930 family lipoprotein [Streptomyces sp. NBC_00086]